jgi:biotin operon repressor
VGREVKNMTDILLMVDLYEYYDSKRQVALGTGISRNTVKKYINRVKNVLEGKETEMLPKNRKIIQPLALWINFELAKILVWGVRNGNSDERF